MFLRYTPAEFAEVGRAAVRRAARQADERAWIVAHLQAVQIRGTSARELMRKLLGRAPGTVPGQPTHEREMTADEGIAALLALGARDQRGETAGA